MACGQYGHESKYLPFVSLHGCLTMTAGSFRVKQDIQPSFTSSFVWHRYLHRGKLRCRRWMVNAMIPRTRELLLHVRQLSQLAADQPAARARARRTKRLLKVHLPAFRPYSYLQ